MKKEILSYLSLQCARFGAIHSKQALMLTEGLCGRSMMYKAMKYLVEKGWLEYHLFIRSRNTTYWRPTNKLWKKLSNDYGFVRPKELRESDLLHSNTVLQTLVNLSHMENVTGLATEYELSPQSLEGFLEGRIPDAIIQLTREGQFKEIAVEVETTLKSRGRIDEILGHYANAFSKPGARCTGLLVVTSLPRINRAYQRACERLPEDVRRRVLVIPDDRVLELPIYEYGYRTPSPVKALEKLRIALPGGSSYESIFSRPWDFESPFKRHRSRHPVTNKENEAEIGAILNA